MRRGIARLVVGLVLVAAPLAPGVAAPTSAAGRTYLKPEESDEGIPILLSGKAREYYGFGIDQPIHVAVVGPTTFTLLVRAVFTPGMPDTAAYGVLIREGDAEVKKHWTTTRRGDGAFVPKSPNVPGASRKLTVEVPAGSHRLAVSLLGDQAEQAVARLYVPGEYKAEAYASIAPLDASETFTALGGEKQIAYYRVDAKAPLTVRVVGPTKLRILSRMNFSFALHGKRRYALTVEEDGKAIRREDLWTTRSTSVVFTDHPDIIPGKDKVTLVDVPGGAHRYTVRLGPASEASSVSIRFTIPQKDLANSSAGRG